MEKVACDPVETLEDAMKDIPFSLLPTTGLRRNSDGDLTDDAVQIILDGLKSRGHDYTSEEPRKKILADLALMYCKTQHQYEFLMNEYSRRLEENMMISNDLEAGIQKRNDLLGDILRISRRLETISGSPTQETFIEGWQTGGGTVDTVSQQQRLQRDRENLRTRSLDTRKHMVAHTREKNKYASNYLGLYGFLNIAALGLLLYVSGLTPRSN